MKPLESAALPDHPDTGALSPQRLESDPLAESTDEPPSDRATQFVPMQAVWAAPKVRLRRLQPFVALRAGTHRQA